VKCDVSDETGNIRLPELFIFLKKVTEVLLITRVHTANEYTWGQ
jgi:hypothetical protein